MFLGENIRYLRKKYGMSQDELAEKLGYKSYTTIQKWESGVSEPPVKSLRKMAGIFSVDMDDMTEIRFGMDVERFSRTAEIFNAQHPHLLPQDEKELLDNYRELLPDNKKRLKKYASSLLSIQTAEQDLLAAHENPDATGTDEDRRHDVEIVKEEF